MHSAKLQLLCEDYSFIYPPLSVEVLIFSELWQREVNEIAKASKWQQEDSNPGSLIESHDPVCRTGCLINTYWILDKNSYTAFLPKVCMYNLHMVMC